MQYSFFLFFLQRSQRNNCKCYLQIMVHVLTLWDICVGVATWKWCCEVILYFLATHIPALYTYMVPTFMEMTPIMTTFMNSCITHTACDTQ